MASERIKDRMRSGWKIRREERWWVPHFAGPIRFIWERPNGRASNELDDTELRQMKKLGRRNCIGPIGEKTRADPPYILIGLMDSTNG